MNLIPREETHRWTLADGYLPGMGQGNEMNHCQLCHHPTRQGRKLCDSCMGLDIDWPVTVHPVAQQEPKQQQEIQMKKCIKCGESFPATPNFFHRKARNKDGLESKCKPCLLAPVYARRRGVRTVKRCPYCGSVLTPWGRCVDRSCRVSRALRDVGVMRGR